jgi:predicted nucleotidyltransferase
MVGLNRQTLLEEISGEFAKLPEVTAVVLSGSNGSGYSDEDSDIDLYVYSRQEPSLAWRTELARLFGDKASIGNEFWEPGDEWILRRSGKVVDIMYRSTAWIEQQFERVLLRHQATVGYSTCFVCNVLHSQTLYDRGNWFATLKEKAGQPYPDSLRRAIVAKNYPILRMTLSSYLHQIEVAMERKDSLSVSHRVVALLASYFDILFAVNRMYHPGEKRLVAYVLSKCQNRPVKFETQVNKLLSATAPSNQMDLLATTNELLDNLDELLIEEQLINQLAN